jgi:SAM-dependent methyltransferase
MLLPISTPSAWGWRRRSANALDRVHLLRPAVSLYETAVGLRDAMRVKGRTESGGLPVPPAQLRVRIAPAQGDLHLFLSSGALHADLIRGLLSDVGSDVAAAAPILDFGCGCGRIARHWEGLDVELHGCDLNPRMVDWCRRNLPFGRFEVNGLEPPLPYGNDSFGLAYAFSVLTHLPEQLQHEWLQEFKRVLRPGGFLLISTQGEPFVELERLTDVEQRRFDAGELVVLFESQAGKNVCSVYHPQAYVENTLARGFDYLVHRQGDEGMFQDLHLLRTSPLLDGA